jgi:hypothetical protein
MLNNLKFSNMAKFYRELPKPILDILIIGDGWLVGSSVGSTLRKEPVNDYDIIISQEHYRNVFRYVQRDHPEFNNNGGIKVTINGLSIDIWIDTLDNFLAIMNKNFEYAYNFKLGLLIANQN